MQADVEKLMARLLTDRALRERFVADPVAVAQASGLTEEESEAIARMPAQDLLTAARSYDAKRAAKRARGRRWPILARLLGRRDCG
jgi:hypothetical protein